MRRHILLAAVVAFVLFVIGFVYADYQDLRRLRCAIALDNYDARFGSLDNSRHGKLMKDDLKEKAMACDWYDEQ